MSAVSKPKDTNQSAHNGTDITFNDLDYSHNAGLDGNCGATPANINTSENYISENNRRTKEPNITKKPNARVSISSEKATKESKESQSNLLF